MQKMLFVGIDVGSIATKAVLLDQDQVFHKTVPTGWSPREAGRQVFDQLLLDHGLSAGDIHSVIGTGYGRIALPFADKSVTEITCHARGAAHLAPESRMVIDIGGQDSKVIRIDQRGKVVDFVMNDKCAAGTGRFLQVIAAALGTDVSELSDLAAGCEPLPLNSMCAVFAESEVIGLLAAGKAKGEIVAGLHQSIVRRMTGMAERVGIAEPVLFSGGVARNDALRDNMERALKVRVVTPEQCQVVGALGAALIARDEAAR